MATLNFEHDGSSMIGWNTSGSSPSYNFLTIPGGAALAGSFTSGGTTTTWVPLIDASGSTLGLVNAASPQSGMATTYTYDPSGTSTASGAANEWPFQYQGMEKEFTDPAPYYYSGSGQFYSPQFVRSLTEAGQTSSSGTGSGPAGNPIAAPSGAGQSYLDWSFQHAELEAKSFLYPDVNISFLEGPSFAIPVAPIIQWFENLISLFDFIFGGSDNPPLPRQLLHGRHPLYPKILGLPKGLNPDEMSAGPEQTCGDLRICNIRPLADDNVLEIPQVTTPATPTPPYVSSEEAMTIDSYLREDPKNSAVDIYNALIADHVEPNEAARLAFGPNPGTPIPNPLETPDP